MIGQESFQGLPDELIQRARGDFEFAARLLHVETRAEALREVGLERDYELDQLLGEVANMSMREALGKFRSDQQVQP